MECRAARPLHAMIRPQHLRAVGHLDRFVWLAARMCGGERQVAGRMPVLCQHDVLETACQADSSSGTTSSPRGTARRAARTEVVLDVDDQQTSRSPISDFHSLRHLVLRAKRLSTSAASRSSASATSTGYDAPRLRAGASGSGSRARSRGGARADLARASAAGRCAAPARHDQLDQRLAACSSLLDRKNIAGHPAVRRHSGARPACAPARSPCRPSACAAASPAYS